MESGKKKLERDQNIGDIPIDAMDKRALAPVQLLFW